jgi:HAD superfamily, subfamily IIIB (Acid phosphatase)
MRRITLSIIAAAVLAVVPATASAQSTGQTIPVPGPILTPLGHTPMVELWDGGGGLPYLGSSSSYNAGDWENTLKQYHDSGVYEQQLAKVDAVAERWISKVAKGKAWGHFKLTHKGHSVKVVHTSKASKGKGKGHDKAKTHGHAKKTAIVFDIDETALSNYSAIVADNFTFGTNSRAETTNETGTAIKPTLDLFNLAKSKGIALFFVTGRGETPDNRSHTEHNLQREGFTGYKQLFLKPAGFTGTTTDYKSGAREQIEQQGYRIIASVGDQYSDLAGGHEAAAFKLPNPFYFLP